MSHTEEARPPRFAARHPILTFLLIAYPVAWTLFMVAAAAHVPQEPATAVATLIGLAAPAVLVAYRSGGRAAVRRLFAGLLRWRIGVGRYLLVIAAMPALTLLIAAATGTLRSVSASGGWGHVV